MVLVDSSVWIEVSRPHGDPICKQTLQTLLKEYEAATCSPVLLEVIGGALKSERKEVRADFSVIPHLPAIPKDWDEAIINGWKLRDKGHNLPWNDVLIGTMALRRNLKAYAHDKHFLIMQDVLGLALYLPGE